MLFINAFSIAFDVGSILNVLNFIINRIVDALYNLILKHSPTSGRHK